MQTNRIGLLLAAFTLCSTLVAATGDQPPFGLAGSPRKDSFKKLFNVAPAGRSSQPESRTKPKVVCGMTVIPVDPSIDPRIRVDVAKAETKFTIRAVQPPICRQD